MKVDLKLLALVSLLLLLGFGVGYFLQSSTLDGQQLAERKADVTLRVDESCLLNQASCKRTINETGSIEFQIGPRPILAVSPLSFSLESRDLDIQSTSLDLSGVDMNMGVYRQEFELVKKSGDLTEWVAKGNLPVCVRNQMEWQADLWLQSKKLGWIKVPYIFTAYKPGLSQSG